MKTQLSVKHNFPYGHFIFIAFCLDENTTFRTVLETTFAISVMELVDSRVTSL